jgi:hypothetical protein
MSGESIVQLAQASADVSRRPTPRTLGVATSDEVEAVLTKPLAVNPTERYETAAEFWTEFRTLILGEQTSAIAASRSGATATAPLASAPTMVDPSPPRPSGTSVSPGEAVVPATSGRAAVVPVASRKAKSSGVGLVVALGVGVAVLASGALLSHATLRKGPLAASAFAAATTAPPPLSSSPAPAEARECPFGMIFIPGGDFFIGSEEKDALPGAVFGNASSASNIAAAGLSGSGCFFSHSKHSLPHALSNCGLGGFPKGKSRFGIQDVVGNVWEWVADWYGDYDKGSARVTDPKGPETGTDRVVRGGAWNGAQPSWVRPSFRYHVAPASRGYAFGLRCAKSA